MRLARPLSSLLLVLLLHHRLSTAGGAVLVNLSTFAASPAGFQFVGAAAFSSHVLDACGVCAGTGSTCAGCDGVPNSGTVTDACGACLLPTDPAFGASCAGCDGVPNSGAALDACGVCRQPGDVAVNTTCAGCDGVPNSGAKADACGVCRSVGDPRVNSTCAGCDGKPNSGAVFDPCCVCNGNATYASPCYIGLNTNGLTKAFDPNSSTWSDFFNAAGQAVYDQCGECVGWGYNNTECSGCDGIPLSGLVFDSCGKCNGTCATCPTGGACGSTGCTVQTRTRGPGINGVPLYTPSNKPGIPPWTSVAANIAQCVDAIPPSYVVLLYGAEFGPFTLGQLQSGALEIVNPQTQKNETLPLTPSTLIGILNHTATNKTLTYGATSALQTRADSWAAAAAAQTDVIYVTQGTLQPNIVVLSVPITTLVNGTYKPVADIVELRGLAYSPCTGVTFRHGAQQTHGKWTGLNPRGLIVSANITDTVDQLANQPWNPSSAFIGDVATTWSDAQCTCHTTWDMSYWPTPPTCTRQWLPAPAGVTLRRTAATGSQGGLLHTAGANGGGGFTMLDGGGQMLSYGTRSQASRPPWRVTSIGALTLSAFVPADPLGPDPPLCRPAARLAPPQAGVRGALWYTAARVPLVGNVTVQTTFSFQFSQAAQACASVARLSRSTFSEEVVQYSHGSCRALTGEGLAVVFLDSATAPNASLVGLGGPAIGFGGLPNSLAVEFDARGNVSAGEPANMHVAVMSRGVRLARRAEHKHTHTCGLTPASPAHSRRSTQSCTASRRWRPQTRGRHSQTGECMSPGSASWRSRLVTPWRQPCLQASRFGRQAAAAPC